MNRHEGREEGREEADGPNLADWNIVFINIPQ